MSDIIFFRHGEANYNVLEIKYNKKIYDPKEFISKFNHINDIKDYSSLDSYIKKLTNYVDFSKYKRIDVWVSPYGRTIDTTKYILKELDKKHIKINKVAIFDILGEVKNFSWKIHNVLVSGGKLKLNDKIVQVDKNKSNPKNLKFSDYFFNDEIKSVYKKYKSYFDNVGLKDYIINIEKFEEVIKRYYKVVNRLTYWLDKSKKDYLVIIVTHQALTDEIILNNYKKYEGLYPGEYILLDLKNGNVVRGKEIK